MSKECNNFNILINMNESSPLKSLSWPLIQPYLTFLKSHQDDIEMVTKLKENGKLKIPAAEESLTQAIVEMHDTVVKILGENKVI
jgi:hypothetical protein